MFGFWVNLLDKGDHFGKPPRRERVNYDVLWEKAFRSAFLRGRAEVRAGPPDDCSAGPRTVSVAGPHLGPSAGEVAGHEQCCT